MLYGDSFLYYMQLTQKYNDFLDILMRYILA